MNDIELEELGLKLRNKQDADFSDIMEVLRLVRDSVVTLPSEEECRKAANTEDGQSREDFSACYHWLRLQLKTVQPSNNREELFKRFVELHQNRALVTVRNSDGTFEDMVIQSVKWDRAPLVPGADSYVGINVEINFKQVHLVSKVNSTENKSVQPISDEEIKTLMQKTSNEYKCMEPLEYPEGFYDGYRLAEARILGGTK